MQSTHGMQGAGASGRRWVRRSLLALALVAGPALAIDGDLDPTFGAGGFALAGMTTATMVGAVAPVVQPDGKILYCGVLQTGGSSADDFVVMRFDADGTLDPSFDFDGRASIDFGGNDDACTSLALQPDGKIVAVGLTAPAGMSSYDFAAARLNADGSLDTTFGGGDGKTTVAFDLGGDNSDVAFDVALQADGKIVMAGGAATAANGTDFAFVRLLTDGTRDTAFHTNGRLTVGFDLPASSTFDDQAVSVAIDEEGRIVAGGQVDAGPGSNDFGVVRLLPDGQLDAAFDADGRATLAFDVGATLNDLALNTILQRDGRIVVVGAADAGSGVTSNLDVAVARFLPDGSPDASFGTGGKVLVPYDLMSEGGDIGFGVVEDTVGRLVVAGFSANDPTPANGTVTRLRADGSLDEGFGSLGKKIIDIGDGNELFGVALQGTQVLAGGLTLSGSDHDLYVVRLLVDLIFADGFE